MCVCVVKPVEHFFYILAHGHREPPWLQYYVNLSILKSNFNCIDCSVVCTWLAYLLLYLQKYIDVLA